MTHKCLHTHTRWAEAPSVLCRLTEVCCVSKDPKGVSLCDVCSWSAFIPSLLWNIIFSCACQAGQVSKSIVFNSSSCKMRDGCRKFWFCQKNSKDFQWGLRKIIRNSQPCFNSFDLAYLLWLSSKFKFFKLRSKWSKCLKPVFYNSRNKSLL